MKDKNQKKSDLWITEKHKNYLCMDYHIQKTLFSKKSDFQSVSVLETTGFGRMLLNDGFVMISERDEFVYHEMIAHVPLFIHPYPRKVLIVGGGDGGTAREVLRHKEVESCDMVEIDALVVEACKKFIPKTACSLNHPRLNLYIEDALDFVKKENKNKYDVVLIDSTDPIGPAEPLFNKDFYQNVHALLNDKGIVVSQAESPFYEKPLQRKLLTILKECFSMTSLYNYSNLTYPGGLWSFSFAVKGDLHPIKDFNKGKWKKAKFKLSYYNDLIHRAAFSLPEFMREAYKDLIFDVFENT